MTPTEQNPSAAVSPKNDVAPPAQGAADTPDSKAAPSECKSLAERPCRKNRACVWIIPKEADKIGQVPAAYCWKHGSSKATVSPIAPSP